MSTHPRRRSAKRPDRGDRPSALTYLVIAVTTYWLAVRRRLSSWGTTLEERRRAMPGDGLISGPRETSMQAITVNAPPEDIWPWLVQMGYRRGGLYSYDWLDRLFGFLDRPSATHILPQFQQLAVGDRIPWDRRGTELTVRVLEPYRALALSYRAGGFMWVWQFGLYPHEQGGTRLLTRGIERVPRTPLWWLGMRLMEPASFIMTRRFLLGVKWRAEALHALGVSASGTSAAGPASGASASGAIPFPGSTPSPLEQDDDQPVWRELRVVPEVTSMSERTRHR